MAVSQTFLPFLPRAPYQVALTDPKTGIMSPAWVRWYQNLEAVFGGIWTDVPYDATNFLNPLGTWTVASTDVAQFQTYQLGPFGGVYLDLITTTISADSDSLVVLVPTLKMITPTAAGFAGDSFGVPTTLFIDGVAEIGYADIENVTDASTGLTVAAVNLFRVGSDFLAASTSIEVRVAIHMQVQNVIVTA